MQLVSIYRLGQENLQLARSPCITTIGKWSYNIIKLQVVTRAVSLATSAAALDHTQPFLAKMSASIMGHPRSSKSEDTDDFPLAMPPVSPKMCISRAEDLVG